MTGDGSISNGVVRFFQTHTQKPAPYFLIVSLNLRLFLLRASERAKGTLMGSTHFSISLEVTGHHMTGFSKDSFSNYLCPERIRFRQPQSLSCSYATCLQQSRFAQCTPFKTSFYKAASLVHNLFHLQKLLISLLEHHQST